MACATTPSVQYGDVKRVFGIDWRRGETEVEVSARQAGEKCGEKAACFGGQPVGVIKEDGQEA